MLHIYVRGLTCTAKHFLTEELSRGLTLPKKSERPGLAAKLAALLQELDHVPRVRRWFVASTVALLPSRMPRLDRLRPGSGAPGECQQARMPQPYQQFRLRHRMQSTMPQLSQCGRRGDYEELRGDRGEATGRLRGNCGDAPGRLREDDKENSAAGATKQRTQNALETATGH